MNESTNITTKTQVTPQAALEAVILHGDLSKMSPAEKVIYYKQVCDSVGLNPLTNPFAYIRLNGKEVLYAKKDATDQLRKLHNVSVIITSREKIDDVFLVTAQAKLPSGRTDESIGAVAVSGARGEMLANLFMKAETKAKRRATLSICGMGLLDENEVESVTQGGVATNDSKAPHKSSAETRASATAPPNPNPMGKEPRTNDQLSALNAAARDCGWTHEDMKVHIAKMGIMSTRDLNYIQFESLVKFMKRFPKAKPPIVREPGEEG